MNFGQFQPANQMETIILVSLFTGQIYYFSVFFCLFFFVEKLVSMENLQTFLDL